MSTMLEPSQTGLLFDTRELRAAVVQHRHAVARGEQELDGWSRAAATTDRDMGELLAAIRTRLAECTRRQERPPARRERRPRLRVVTGED